MNNCPLCNQLKPSLKIEYNCSNCGHFYMTPGFVALLEQIAIRYGHKQSQQVIEKVKQEIKKSDQVIAFVENYEKYQHMFPRLLEIDDICSPLGIDVIGNSRGSDYGD